MTSQKPPKHSWSQLRFVSGQLWRGNSVLRAYLNERLQQETLRGSTIDVGSGKDSAYSSVIPRTEDTQLTAFDIKAGDTQVDFETDRLPAEDGTFDTVLFLNVMEHIYNHNHIASEVIRIVKPGGQLIGFVPFLMWYHPDHRDFFRYTHEALENILRDAGGEDITIDWVGGGPFVASAHMMLLSAPRILRPPLFWILYALDTLFAFLKKGSFRPYALGYLFVVNK